MKLTLSGACPLGSTFGLAVCLGLALLTSACGEDGAGSPTAATVGTTAGSPGALASGSASSLTAAESILQEGERVRFRGNVYLASDCPQRCTLRMKKADVRVSSTTTLVRELSGGLVAVGAEVFRVGLPVFVTGEYRRGVVEADTVTIEAQFSAEGILMERDSARMVVEISSKRAGTARIELVAHPSVYILDPLAGNLVSVRGSVREDLSLPFIATRVQRLD